MRLRISVFIGLFGVLPVQAQAVDCKNPQAQLEMTACAQLDWQNADVDLNNAYLAAQAAMKAIDATMVGAKRNASETLRAAERTWITYRDAACLAESFAWRGGSGELMAIYACRARITRARATDLWAMTIPK